MGLPGRSPKANRAFNWQERRTLLRIFESAQNALVRSIAVIPFDRICRDVQSASTRGQAVPAQIAEATCRPGQDYREDAMICAKAADCASRFGLIVCFGGSCAGACHDIPSPASSAFHGALCAGRWRHRGPASRNGRLERGTGRADRPHRDAPDRRHPRRATTGSAASRTCCASSRSPPRKASR